MPARELLNGDARAIELLSWKQLGQVFAQVVFKRLQVEFFTGTDWRGVAGL
jgi:hypothetical protein